LQLQLDRIKALGASVVAISPESNEETSATAALNNLTYDVVSDLGNHIARQFGIVFQLPEELRPIYAGFGIDIPKVNLDETYELPIPATFIIASDGKIRKAFVEADYTKRLDPEEIVEVLEDMARK
jgi:peroxiredoxin